MCSTRPVQCLRLVCLLGLFAPTAAFALPTAAQDGGVIANLDEESPESSPRRRGFQVGAGLQAIVVTSAVDGTDPGGGLGFGMGYGIQEWAVVYLRGTFTSLASSDARPDSYGMGYWDLGVRFQPARAGRLEPYVEGGWADQTVVAKQHIYSRGHAGTLGVGAEFFLAPSWALDLGLSHTRGTIRETRENNRRWEPLGDDSFHVASTRLRLALVWHR